MSREEGLPVAHIDFMMERCIQQQLLMKRRFQVLTLDSFLNNIHDQLDALQPKMEMEERAIKIKKSSINGVGISDDELT